MAKIDLTMKRILAWTIVVCVVTLGVMLYVHLLSEQRQAERELIYIKARAMAAQQQRERTQQWKKRRQEQELNRQFQKGRVVDLSQPPAKAETPAAAK